MDASNSKKDVAVNLETTVEALHLDRLKFLRAIAKELDSTQWMFDA